LKTEDGSGKTRLLKLFVFLDYFSDALIRVTGLFCPVRLFQWLPDHNDSGPMLAIRGATYQPW
jgi:hypothetical protein